MRLGVLQQAKFHGALSFVYPIWENERDWPVALKPGFGLEWGQFILRLPASMLPIPIIDFLCCLEIEVNAFPFPELILHVFAGNFVNFLDCFLPRSYA